MGVTCGSVLMLVTAGPGPELVLGAAGGNSSEGGKVESGAGGQEPELSRLDSILCCSRAGSGAGGGGGGAVSR